MYGSSVYGAGVYGVEGGHPYAATSGRVMWLLQVDWDGDGVWGSEIEPQSLRSLEVVRGLAAAGDERFRVEAVDPAGRYDPFNAQGPLFAHLGRNGQALRLLLVSSTGREAAQPVFVGTLEKVEYRAQDGTALLSGAGLSCLLQTGQAAALWTPAQPMLPGGAWDACFVPDGSTPFPVNYWKGRPGGLPLRECAALTLARAGWPFGAFYGWGETLHPGDGPDYFYFDGSSAWDTLRELVEAFAARLMFLRDGRVFVMERGDLCGLAQGLPPPERAQQTPGLERVSPPEGLRNQVQVRIRLHSVTPFKMPILPEYYVEAWSNSGPLALGAGETLEIDVHYAGGKPLQGSFLSVNNGGFAVNYEAWSAADQTGTLMSSEGTGEAEFTLLWEEINGAVVPYGNRQSWTRVRFKNWSAGQSAYYFNTKVMLIGINETGQPLVQQAEDAESVRLVGPRALTINSRWVQSAHMGAEIAQAYVDMLAGRERSGLAAVTYQWSGEALYQNLIQYDLGTHVDFGQAGSGLLGRWLVVGQRVRWLSPDGQDALVTLTYEKALDA